MVKFLFLFLLALIPFRDAAGIPLENYTAEYESTVVPFFESNKKGCISPERGVQLKYYYLPHPEAVGSIVLMAGWTEATEKYREIIYDFYQYKLNVFMMDWRGQGRSHRALRIPTKLYRPLYDLR